MLLLTAAVKERLKLADVNSDPLFGRLSLSQFSACIRQALKIEYGLLRIIFFKTYDKFLMYFHHLNSQIRGLKKYNLLLKLSLNKLATTITRCFKLKY